MWIKLHHTITKWEWFTIPEMVQIFIYLLANAAYKDTSYQGRTIRRGQLITSVENIRSDTRLSTQQIRTCLKRLESTNEITRKSTNKFSVITICNYDKYQADKEDEQQPNNNPITNEQQSNNNITELQNNINYISLNNAHARESLIPPDLEDCFNILSSDRGWQEAVLMNIRSRGYKHVMFEQLQEYLHIFFSKLKAEGQDFKQPSDARHHFANWILIQLENQKHENNRNTHSRKQEANAYALSQFADYYSNMDEEIPNPFTD